MTQPNQTTPTVLSTGPWTIAVCDEHGADPEFVVVSNPGILEGFRVCCDECGRTANHVDVIPLSTLSRLVEELEARAAKAASDARNETDPIYAAGEWGADDAYRDAASLISQSLPTPQEDE
jgi:hypothetical protein